MKQLMLGNEAVARGLYEAGVRVISSYPGTPSTEMTEFAAEYDEMYSEWAPNEKVAMEVAAGASIAGARSFCAMKHVGMNVAADPMYTASYTGVNAGMVIGVADDPGMHSSQNEQDSRHHAIASKLAMLEPADSAECLEYTKMAYELSEQFDTPVIVRLTTRISHSRSMVEIGEREEKELKDFPKDPQKYVMMPAMAVKRHAVIEERQRKLAEYAETTPLNRIEENGAKIGVITAGICYQYAREALGDKANYLKLGMVNPLPVQLIRKFAEQCEKVYVIDLHSFGLNYGADVIIGNNFNKSCSNNLTNFFQTTFLKSGFTVKENNPYSGGYITKHYGKKETACEAIQLELWYCAYIQNKIFGKEEFPMIDKNTFNHTQIKLEEIFKNFKEWLQHQIQ